jgi:hypothetical protein
VPNDLCFDYSVHDIFDAGENPWPLEGHGLNNPSATRGHCLKNPLYQGCMVCKAPTGMGLSMLGPKFKGS